MFYFFLLSYSKPRRDWGQATDRCDFEIGLMASQTVCRPRVSIPERRRAPFHNRPTSRGLRPESFTQARLEQHLSWRNFDAKIRDARNVRRGHRSGDRTSGSDDGTSQSWERSSCVVLRGYHGCAHYLRELSSDGLDVTQGSLKNSSRGTGTADKLLYETVERSDAGFPWKTSTGGVAERWCQRRKRGGFDGGGGDWGRELLHTTLYCRVPSTPNRPLGSTRTRGLGRLGCDLSCRIN